jgi:hypothetical protein
MTTSLTPTFLRVLSLECKHVIGWSSITQVRKAYSIPQNLAISYDSFLNGWWHVNEAPKMQIFGTNCTNWRLITNEYRERFRSSACPKKNRKITVPIEQFILDFAVQVISRDVERFGERGSW